MNQKIKIKIKLAAIKTLKKEIGIKNMLMILPELIKKQKRGEPFGSFAPPLSQKDKESRELIGEAILLYRILQKIVKQSEAEQIIRKVIIESAVAQLSCLVPKMTKAQLNAMSDDAKKREFCNIVSKFPNADFEVIKAEGNEYFYDITRCRLVELIDAVGHPELKNAFCAGDGVYFDRHQPDLEFKREAMIGEDCKTCEFRFYIKE